MRIDELPEEFKQYMMILSNDSQYLVNGKQKEVIINSSFSFATLPNGSVINKAFIVEFKLDIQATKDYFEENRDRILNKDGTKLLTRNGEV